MSVWDETATPRGSELRGGEFRSAGGLPRLPPAAIASDGISMATCDAADEGSIVWAWGTASFLRDLGRRTSAPMVWAIFDGAISSCYISNSLHGVLAIKTRPRHDGMEEERCLCVGVPGRSFYRSVDEVPYKIDAENKSWKAVALLGTMASCAIGDLGACKESAREPGSFGVVGKVLTRAAVPLLGKACDELGDRAEARRIAGAKGRHLRLLLQIVRERFRDPSFSLRRLSALSGLSNRYVNAIFQESGASFSERILDARLRWAYQELRYSSQTGRRIGKIAYDAGFTDQPYFNRAFKRRFGMSPREILRRFDLDTEGEGTSGSVQQTH